MGGLTSAFDEPGHVGLAPRRTATSRGARLWQRVGVKRHGVAFDRKQRSGDATSSGARQSLVVFSVREIVHATRGSDATTLGEQAIIALASCGVLLLAYAAMSFTARPAFTSAIDLEAKYRSLLAAHDETVHAVALLKREAELPAAKVDASLTSLQGKLQALSASVEAAEQARAALVRAQEGMAERVNRMEAASTSVGQAMEEKAAQLRARTESHLTEIEVALAHLKTDFAAIEGKDIVAHIARLRASVVEEAVTAVLDAVSSERLALHASVNDTASALMSSVRKELMAEVKKETATVIGRHVGEQVGKAVLDQKSATSLLNWFDSSKGKIDHAAMEMAVKSVLAKLYTDRLGKVDWLLGINGARILSSSDTNCNSGSMLDSAFCRLVPSLSAVQLNSESFLSGDVQTDTSWLETSAAVLGNCWAMKGAQGHVTVALVQPIKPSQFVVQHAPVSITVDAGKSAPRSFRIQGRLPPDAAAPAGTQRSWVDLVQGQYHLMGFNAHSSNLTPHMQTFDSVSGFAVDAVRFEVLDNHGSELTCLYHLRMYGDAA